MFRTGDYFSGLLMQAVALSEKQQTPQQNTVKAPLFRTRPMTLYDKIGLSAAFLMGLLVLLPVLQKAAITRTAPQALTASGTADPRVKPGPDAAQLVTGTAFESGVWVHRDESGNRISLIVSRNAEGGVILELARRRVAEAVGFTEQNRLSLPATATQAEFVLNDETRYSVVAQPNKRVAFSTTSSNSASQTVLADALPQMEAIAFTVRSATALQERLAAAKAVAGWYVGRKTAIFIKDLQDDGRIEALILGRLTSMDGELGLQAFARGQVSRLIAAPKLIPDDDPPDTVDNIAVLLHAPLTDTVPAAQDSNKHPWAFVSPLSNDTEIDPTMLEFSMTMTVQVGQGASQKRLRLTPRVTANLYLEDTKRSDIRPTDAFISAIFDDGLYKDRQNARIAFNRFQFQSPECGDLPNPKAVQGQSDVTRFNAATDAWDACHSASEEQDKELVLDLLYALGGEAYYDMDDVLQMEVPEYCDCDAEFAALRDLKKNRLLQRLFMTESLSHAIALKDGTASDSDIEARSTDIDATLRDAEGRYQYLQQTLRPPRAEP